MIPESLLSAHAAIAAPIGGIDAWLLLDRAVVGGFFTITGTLKSTVWRASTLETFQWFHMTRGLPFPKFNARFVPAIQTFAGLGVLTGSLAPLAAFGLIVVMSVALWADGQRQIEKIGYANRLEWFNNLCYLPETLYIVGLAAIIALGAGSYSIDGAILTWTQS